MNDHFIATDPAKIGFLTSHPWVLCVGAGVSFGIVPTWFDLAWKIVAREMEPGLTKVQFQEWYGNVGWGLDAWLQAALNHHIENGGNPDSYTGILTAELYGDMLDRADAHGIRGELERLISDPFRRPKKSLVKACDFLRQEYGSTTLIQLSEVLLDAFDSGRAPRAILNLNADTLLHVVVSLFHAERHMKQYGGVNPGFFPYKAIYRSSHDLSGSVPIYHIHGSIGPRASTRQARDKLVFQETEYSDVAGSMFSFPQATFLYFAQSDRMVFLGLSMSDMNLRKWMRWSHLSRQSDLLAIDPAAQPSSRHLWVMKTSPDPRIQDALRGGLHHLGIRLAELNSWLDIGPAMRNLLRL